MTDEQQMNPRSEGQQPEKSERYKRRQERLARVRKGMEVLRVRVVPRDDDIRRFITHPSGGGLAFPAEGSVEWPFDTFTQRRIRDGDITIEEKSKEGAPQP